MIACIYTNQERKITMREEGAFELYDKFGQAVVEDVRDGALSLAANIVKGTTNNKVDLSYYECFSELSEEQKEKICDLISETVTDTIFRFLKMFEEKENEMKLELISGDESIDILDACDDIGAEITFTDEDGWIPRFSDIGMLVER